jgi:SnoaL-like polyketide cyclase
MKGNRSIVEEAFSPNFALHSRTHIDRPLRGLEGARVMTSVSDLAETQVTIEDIFGEGDRVAVRRTFCGIYRGASKPGYPQPGERCTIEPSVLTASSTGRSRTIGEHKRFGTRRYAVGMIRDLLPPCVIQLHFCAYHARHSKDLQKRRNLPLREDCLVLGRSIGKHSGSSSVASGSPGNLSPSLALR